MTKDNTYVILARTSLYPYHKGKLHLIIILNQYLNNWVIVVVVVSGIL